MEWACVVPVHSAHTCSTYGPVVVTVGCKCLFDSVPHRQLLSQLKRIGLSAYIVNWIANYLTDRTQSVVLNGVSSQPLPVLSGVPQGSVLGPLLFLMYINDINDTGISAGSKLVLYADDILLYRAVQSQEDYATLQQDVNALAAWSSSKLLRFNPTKCKAMCIPHSTAPGVCLPRLGSFFC